MLNYLNNIKNKILKLDKIAQNPFTQANNKYNPCQSCVIQTYVWIEEDIKNDFSTNPFVKNARKNQK